MEETWRIALPGPGWRPFPTWCSEAAAGLAHELGVQAVYQDHRRIMDDKNIEAVVVCSSTDTHAEMIEAAAAAGKHVFCEKPIDHDLAKIDHALAAVERAGVKLQVGFNRRFDPSFKRVHDLVAAGEVGTPHLLRITSRDPAPPPLAYVRVSGGLFLDMAIHDFDMARYLMGSEVEEVYAAADALIDPEIGRAGDVDTAVTTLRFAGGALGSDRQQPAGSLWLRSAGRGVRLARAWPWPATRHPTAWPVRMLRA